jgi:metal-sulfur cluster biosynthetic enzyme
MNVSTATTSPSIDGSSSSRPHVGVSRIPEIPASIVELGLVYLVTAEPVEGGHKVSVRMTLTAPGCGIGPVLVDDVRRKVLGVAGVKDADVELVFDPPWDPSRMSDAAKLELGFM